MWGLIIAEDCGQRAYSGYPVEMYAEFFAFLSLVHPNGAERSDYGDARTHAVDAWAQPGRAWPQRR